MENKTVILALEFNKTFIMNCEYTMNISVCKLLYEKSDCLIHCEV